MIVRQIKRITWVKDASVQFVWDGEKLVEQEPHLYDEVLHATIEYEDGTLVEYGPDMPSGATFEQVAPAIDWAWDQREVKS